MATPCSTCGATGSVPRAIVVRRCSLRPFGESASREFAIGDTVNYSTVDGRDFNRELGAGRLESTDAGDCARCLGLGEHNVYTALRAFDVPLRQRGGHVKGMVAGDTITSAAIDRLAVNRLISQGYLELTGAEAGAE